MAKEREKLKIEGEYAAEMFHAIGLLIFQATFADGNLLTQLNRLITMGGGFTPGLYTVTLGLDPSTKLKMIRTMMNAITIGTSSDVAAVNRACDALDADFDKRNLFAHGVPMPTEEKNKMHMVIQSPRVIVKEGGLGPPQKYTVDDVLGWSDRFQKDSQALIDAVTAAGIPPLLGGPPKTRIIRPGFVMKKSRR